MGKIINWGIMGTGRIATQFAHGLNQARDAELVAVGSRTLASAEKFAQEFSTARAFESYQDLVMDNNIDVIYIATPHSLHMENAMMCLEAGKAVLCEKPFTINAAEAKQVIDLARDRKLFLMEAMWTRYIPAMVRLRELVQQNVIGDIQVLLAGGAFIPDFNPEFYLFNKELGGGVLLDAGVYLVSLASMLFGSPEKIMAIGRLGNTGVDEHDAIILQHQCGAIANLYVSLRARSSPDITLLGSKGQIYLHPPLFCPSKITLAVHGKDEVDIDLPFASNGYQFEASEVNDCLRQGRTESEIMPLDETLTIMQTMDEIRQQIGMKYNNE